MVINYNRVVSTIDKPNYNEKVIKKYQSIDEIIKELIYCFKTYNYQARPVAKLYATGNIKTDAKNIYDFVKNEIEYKAEPEEDQTSRSFTRILHDKWGDCKHTALTVAAIGWNEGYNVIFRVVRYATKTDDGKKSYLYHIYTVLEDKNGKQIIVDPLQDYNYQKSFDKKVGDFKATNDMSLTRLSGVPNAAQRVHHHAHGKHHKHGVHKHHAHHAKHLFAPTPSQFIEAHEVHTIDGIGQREIILTPLGMTEDTISGLEDMQGIGRRTKAQRQAARKGRRDKRHVRQAARKANRKARGGLFKTIALAPVRGAFSALLLLNFKNFAGRFIQAIQKGKESDVKAFAKKFGYKYNIFLGQVKRGAKKHALGEISGTEVHQVEGMGFVVTATAIATASAAIVAAASLFKKLGLGHQDDASMVKDAADNLGKDLGSGSNQTFSENKSDSSQSNSGGGSGGGGGSSSDQGGGASSQSADDSATPSKEDSKGGNDSGGDESFMSKKVLGLPMPVVLVGSAGILFFAGKKMKLW